MRSLVSLDTISCPLGLPLPLEGLGLVVTQTHVGAGTRALLGPRASASRRRALRGAAQGGADVVSRFSLLAPEARCGALRTPGTAAGPTPNCALSLSFFKRCARSASSRSFFSSRNFAFRVVLRYDRSICFYLTRVPPPPPPRPSCDVPSRRPRAACSSPATRAFSCAHWAKRSALHDRARELEPSVRLVIVGEFSAGRVARHGRPRPRRPWPC